MFLISLFHNSDDCLFHFLLQNVILSRLVNLIQEFLFPFLVCFSCLLGGHSDIRLLLKIYLEQGIVLPSEGLDRNSNLFAKIISGCLGERPLDELLFRDYFVWFWFWFVRNLWDDWLCELNRQMDVCFLSLENFFEFLLVNP